MNMIKSQLLSQLLVLIQTQNAVLFNFEMASRILHKTCTSQVEAL